MGSVTLLRKLGLDLAQKGCSLFAESSSSLSKFSGQMSMGTVWDASYSCGSASFVELVVNVHIWSFHLLQANFQISLSAQGAHLYFILCEFHPVPAETRRGH